MVQLELKSSVDQKQQPFLHSWDSTHRINHRTYQNKIDKLTYHLQRSQRGLFILGEWFYPRFFQKDVLNLEILQKKQWLGKINQDEVENFKRFNPEIATDLNRTFSAKLPWPKTGLAIGAAGFLFGAIFNYRYSYRLGFVLLPILADFSIQQFDKSCYFRTLEFLNWATEFRREKARAEKYNLQHPGQAKEQAFQGNVWDNYQKIVELVINEAPRV
ncbi:hypothetical protein PPERSA_13007 [Pseudocohnilembus persalinus]|uniref:Uncharacterized protein n=1 Tax=Pseudocohnilembus persalinus TaxID=266149 RepID=A0A0V0R1Z2_PSEPJ|nr:hypothetical protein PPERSA_13007 [Pseudocohnilembus persalinus]|eukprot:KRX08526.1 hypothetical protein PPERSA_13007 [Pseudocohnilembus persalinus]